MTPGFATFDMGSGRRDTARSVDGAASLIGVIPGPRSGMTFHAR